MINCVKFFLLYLFSITSVSAAAILDITPSSTNPIVLSENGSTYLTFTLRNNASVPISGIVFDPAFGAAQNLLTVSVFENQCNTTLQPNAVCTFNLRLIAKNLSGTVKLMPRACAFRGVVCSVTAASNRVTITATNRLPNSQFPTPYAGTYYPLYNAGVGQWIVPTTMMPFDKVSAIFAAFAHAYPQGNGAVFSFERGQPNQAERLATLSQVARSVNPNIKILISLGWGKNDWDYINQDYVNHANIFVNSVVQFIRDNNLDGLDIDDEDIGGTSGTISQTNFDGVIANIRNALNTASLTDGKPYYLTITPAGNNDQPGGFEDTQVDSVNMASFNLINIQTYYNGSATWAEDFFDALIAAGYPNAQIANGIDTETCTPTYPPYVGFAGIFNWNMSSDSACNNFENTDEIATLVGYPFRTRQAWKQTYRAN